MEDPFDFSREPWNSRGSRPAHYRARHGPGQCGSRRHNTSYQKEEQVLRLWQDLQALEMEEKKK
ncbi:phosphatase and actin regulator 4 [Homo sapiens]|uniref:Isoform 4 of Phosphatase and actin regulator 4 n=1 Tax=Homo sapiens TaxID=9606 RepID=Q8IZ21-4|nr:phosphatase and actin regulator 4 [Homo sapiens]KAI4079467.1 phosphatase and actin regulator 4 [Homo sapiens]